MKIQFGPFTLDRATRQLARGDREIHLSPKGFELLTILVDERPRALSKAELQERLWPGTFVAEANLSNLVAEIRAAIGDRSRAPVFIRTVHRFGYAFCGDATMEEPHSVGKQTRNPSFWLVWGSRRIPLAEGDNIVGRDPDVEVTLDATTVSRRHARITLTGTRAMLEDLGSKNGTFLAGQRLTSTAQLSHGDLVGFGSLSVIFHERPPVMSTETQPLT